MADKFEDVAGLPENTLVTFHVNDGEPISGNFIASDTEARTVTLVSGGKRRIVQFPPDAPPIIAGDENPQP
jgi:hypothetical protein